MRVTAIERFGDVKRGDDEKVKRNAMFCDGETPPAIINVVCRVVLMSYSAMIVNLGALWYNLPQRIKSPQQRQL